MAKLITALAVAYALSPLDLIPDFIPVFGYLDDLIILPSLVALTIKLIPADVFAACRREAEAPWTDRKPKRWVYALPIVFIWLLIVYWVVRAFLADR